MNQDTPTGGGFGATTGNDFGTSTGSASSGIGTPGTAGSGTGYSGGTGVSTAGTGTGTGVGSEICSHCGGSGRTTDTGGAGIDQFLGRLGISEDMITNLKSSLGKVDVEEYLNTARDYLRSNTEKAKSYTKENPGKVAAGAAVLAIGAGLLISALNRDEK